MRILAHPFRLAADGTVATVEQDSDAATAQLLGALISTVRGERELVPTFGITDPLFSEIDIAEVSAGVALHGPDVQISSVEASFPDELTERVVITWQNLTGSEA